MADNRRAQRKAVGLLVKLKHPNRTTFAEEFATNLSEGGMFIRSRQPQPVGTLVKFEVQIAGGERVMQGLAVVRWVRNVNDPLGPPGMGLQFEKLDEFTQALVEQMLKPKAKKSAPPPAPPIAPAIAPVVPPVAPMAKVAAASPAPKKATSASAQPAVELEVPIVSQDAPGIDLTLDLAEVPPTPLGAVDIELDTLLGSAPTPSAAAPTSATSLDDIFARLEQESASTPALELALDTQDLGAPLSSAAPPPKAKAEALPPVRRGPAAKEEPKKKPVLLESAKPAPAPVQKAGPVFLTPPAKLSADGLIIGIDLGTTNSCVALLQSGRPAILRSKDGYNTLPSVVSLTSANKLLVAHRAKSQMILNPASTIYGAKRLVGRPFDSAVVQQVRERFHYEVLPGHDGRAAVQLGPHVLSLEEVQGIILRECKEMAEQQLGKPVTRAVITVPAYYSEPQREAVRKAGAMAGLKVERILNEPTAAALAFGLNRQLNKKVLVYDLGGGTFDATLLKIENNVFEVLATGGDIFLGGIDFDNKLVDLLLTQFQETEKLAFEGDSIALSRVSEAAEKAKCALSERASYDVHIPMVMMDGSGKPHDLRCTMTREMVHAACGPLVLRTLDVVRDVLLDANVKPKEVDEIILVGGQSRMPMVRDRLKEFFGKAAHASVNADEAVALGAALYCGTVDKVSSVVLIDVLPMTVGVGMTGGAFKRVIERNTPLPAQRSFALATSKDNETTIELSVFQGEDANVAGNEYLGTVRIEDLPKAPKGMVKVGVTLRLDAECVLYVEAIELSSRKAIKATLATRYTAEEIRQKLGISEEVAKKAEAGRAEELKARAGGFWGFLKRIVQRH
ncbi:MAG: TIGR02266 family protein [Myxococcota bacterium]